MVLRVFRRDIEYLESTLVMTGGNHPLGVAGDQQMNQVARRDDVVPFPFDRNCGLARAGRVRDSVVGPFG